MLRKGLLVLLLLFIPILIHTQNTTSQYEIKLRSKTTGQLIPGKDVDLYQNGVKKYDLVEESPGIYRNSAVATGEYDVYVDGKPLPGYQGIWIGSNKLTLIQQYFDDTGKIMENGIGDSILVRRHLSPSLDSYIGSGGSVNNLPDEKYLTQNQANEITLKQPTIDTMRSSYLKVFGDANLSGMDSVGLYKNEQNKNVFVAESYGALGDGYKDNATILNNLLSKKGKVYIGNGTFIIGSTLNIGDSLQIIGSKNTIIKRKNGFTGPLLTFRGSAKDIVIENLIIDNVNGSYNVFDEGGKDVDGFIMRHVKILNHSSFNLIGTGPNFNNKNILIENCEFEAQNKLSTTNYGSITIENGINVIIRNTKFDGVLLKLEAYNNHNSERWYVYNCSFDSIAQTSLFLRPYYDCTIKDIYVYNNSFRYCSNPNNPKGPFAMEQGGAGQNQTYVYNVNIINNYLLNTGRTLYIGDSVHVDGLRYIGNYHNGYNDAKTDTGAVGIWLGALIPDAVQNVVIANNYVANIKYPAIKLGHVKNVVIANNIFENVGMRAPTKDMSGIHVYSWSKNVTIEGNTFINVGDVTGTDQYSTGIYIYESSNIDNVVIQNNRFISTESTPRLKSGVTIARAAGGTDYYPTNIVIKNNDFRGALQFNYYALVMRGSGSVNQADTWVFEGNVVDTLFKPITTSTTLYEEHMTGLGYSNEGATGAVTITLYKGHKGQSIQFLKVANQIFRVDFQASDSLLGGNGPGKYLELSTVGTFVKLRCIKSNEWIIEKLSGSVAYEP